MPEELAGPEQAGHGTLDGDDLPTRQALLDQPASVPALAAGVGGRERVNEGGIRGRGDGALAGSAEAAAIAPFVKLLLQLRDHGVGGRRYARYLAGSAGIRRRAPSERDRSGSRKRHRLQDIQQLGFQRGLHRHNPSSRFTASSGSLRTFKLTCKRASALGEIWAAYCMVS